MYVPVQLKTLDVNFLKSLHLKSDNFKCNCNWVFYYLQESCHGKYIFKIQTYSVY